MNRRSVVGVSLGILLFGLISSAAAQSESHEHQPAKTISITAQGRIEVPPDFAVLHVGIHTYGATHEEAYEKNLKLSSRLLTALKAGGEKDVDIETSTLTTNAVDQDNRTPDRQFEAKQNWSIRTEVNEAQRMLDLALKSGANESSAPTWEVQNHAELHLQALAIASKKARDQADAIAKALGLRVSGVYSASEGDITSIFGISASYSNISYGRNSAVIAGGGNVMQLFPERVSETAIVTVLFSIQ